MPRIRTVKPEFWEDELLGVLPRDARLLFIATFNMADDEGLLRWTPAYVKAQAFMYDDDLTVGDVGKLMQCLTDAGLVFPFIAGAARQQMAVVVNFRKHQRINRPQKSKLPPPSTGAWQVREMYARRDGWVCQLCGGEIPRALVVNDGHNLAVDHIRPVAAGGTDHPSNVRAVHQVCERGRRGTPGGEEFIPPAGLAGLEDSLNESLNRSREVREDSLNDPVNKSHAPSNFEAETDTRGENFSLNHSLTEGKGREQGRERKGTPHPLAVISPAAPPSRRRARGPSKTGCPTPSSSATRPATPTASAKSAKPSPTPSPTAPSRTSCGPPSSASAPPASP
ncbi:HNH endonuclease [Streptomyces chrestomyceticus]|uniref:HNH endonuclease n=1 Tax=Streptomyces chrestomyceticus TaxID=68185 RepID=UPI000F61EF8F|nr:HNH endonuclease signature motif containing protein [Streptomyces chrestomyceticus]